MEFVSAEWVHDEVFNTFNIKAIGDDGNEYFVPSADSDVHPWPDFMKKHGRAAITGTAPLEAAPKQRRRSNR